MSLFGKILAVLNLLAAAVLLYLAGQSFYARNNWTKHLDNRIAQRDGIPADKLLEDMDSADRDRVMKEFKSLFVRRREAGSLLYSKEDPLSPEAQKLVDKLGPSDYQRLVLNNVKEQQPKLRDEEQNLAREKAKYLSLEARYASQQTRLNDDIQSLQGRSKLEESLEKRVLQENEERKKELARLFTELEEAVAARNLAEGKETDTRAELARLRKEIEELAKKNQELAGQIQRLELGR